MKSITITRFPIIIQRAGRRNVGIVIKVETVALKTLAGIVHIKKSNGRIYDFHTMGCGVISSIVRLFDQFNCINTRIRIGMNRVFQVTGIPITKIPFMISDRTFRYGRGICKFEGIFIKALHGVGNCETGNRTWMHNHSMRYGIHNIAFPDYQSYLVIAGITISISGGKRGAVILLTCTGVIEKP